MAIVADPSRCSSVSTLPPEVVLHALAYLDRDELLQCLCVSKAWHRLADSDAIWRPIAEAILSKRLCLLPDVPCIVAGATGTSRVCRTALKRAFEDAKRAEITVDDVAGRPFHLRFICFPSLSAVNVGFPTAVPPLRLIFSKEMVVQSDAGPNYMLLSWRFVPPMRGYTPIDGGRALEPPDPDAPSPRYSCLQLGNRPPMRAWRHPLNWGIVLTSYRGQLTTFPITDEWDDAALNRDLPFIHPYVVHPPLQYTPTAPAPGTDAHGLAPSSPALAADASSPSHTESEFGVSSQDDDEGTDSDVEF